MTSPPASSRNPDESGPSGSVAALLGRLFLGLLGWRVEGALPAGNKAVVIAAPHTSNWDMPFMLAVAYVLGVKPSWLGKREMFRWPLAGLMRRLGGLPVDRRARTNLVQQVVSMFDAADRLYVVIPPSATRSRARHWKSGFYHIARGAEVPIVCSFLDYRRRVGGIGLAFFPSGDVRADMGRIREFYSTVVAKYPGQATPILLPEENDLPAALPGRPAGAGSPYRNRIDSDIADHAVGSKIH